MSANDIDAKRRALDDARSAVAKLAADLLRDETALAKIARTRPGSDPAVAAAAKARARTLAALAAARQRETDASTALTDAVVVWLPPDHTRDVARLDAAHPILLFPVRVETRFDAPGRALLVRVYPDEILADAHDPRLTATELADGQAFWASPSDDAARREAWRSLIADRPAARAGWIVGATDPAAGTPPPLRPENGTRPVEAPLLPDRWVAISRRGSTTIGAAVSLPVRQPLALATGLEAFAPELLDIAGDKVEIDPRIRWTMDFAEAEAAGMALRLPLGPTELAQGFDRLLVFGVKSSLDPNEAARQVAALLDAHHFSREFAFVPQGTPTNDSKGAPSGYPAPDPNGSHSFDVERGPSLAAADGDGVRWARAIGVKDDVIAHVAGAQRSEQQAAEAMSRALFTPTWGYFLREMMAPVVAAGDVDAVRSYFVHHVRGRGPLPAFRVGHVPYGIVPVSSLTRWQPRNDTLERTLAPVLRSMRESWRSQISFVPRVGRTGDPDADLLGVLGMDASARQARIRYVLGQDTVANLLIFLGADAAPWSEQLRRAATQLLQRIGHPEWDPRVVHGTVSDSAKRFRFPLVTAPPLSETDLLAPDYIAWIKSASVAELTAQSVPFPSVPTALLYRLLRHGLLTEYRWHAHRVLVDANIVTAGVALEPELSGIVPGTEAARTIWQRMGAPVAGVTGTRTLGDFVSVSDGSSGPPPAAILSYQDALTALSSLPTAELERLTSETLDLASHRLDAWITSLATKRLVEMREATPTGVHVGAFAWLEEIRPDADPTIVAPDGKVARGSVGGYIHAPTMTHAATAAVLRNSFLTHADAGGDMPYAVDLSSARVRAARFVLDSVRQGQSLGAVLGYMFERALHERQSEILIDQLRGRYPLVANKSEDAGEPAAAIAARNVVDGLRLRTANRDQSLDFSTLNYGSPADANRVRTQLSAALAELDDAVDAVADLELAEAVHQVVRGSTMAASASLDALATGARPPDPDISKTLRGGTSLTHRVAILLGGNPIALPDGWPAQPTARAAAEPWLDAWVGSLLGDPRRVRCRVDIEDGGTSTVKVVALDRLGLRPLDLLALCGGTADEGASVELQRRAIDAADAGTLSAAARVTVVFTRPESDHSDPAGLWLGDVIAVARAIRDVTGAARQLTAIDLALPDNPSAASNATPDGGEALARAGAAAATMQQVRNRLSGALEALRGTAGSPTGQQLANLRAALRDSAAFGVPDAYPFSPERPVAALIDQSAAVLAELDARLRRANDARPAATSTAAQRADAAQAMVRQIFAPDFRLIIGFKPAAATDLARELALALDGSAALIGDADAPVRWLQQVSRVRAPLGRWRMMRLQSEAIGADRPAFDVAQLPFNSAVQWMALPFRNEDDRAAGRLSLVLQRVVTPALTDTWHGLLLDEWTEIVPNPSEHTGLAFHYDDPGAEAPQTLLLAVPPTDAPTWDFDTLVDILEETLELAKLRGVDGELLGDLLQTLPAIYLTFNPAGDTVSTSFQNALREDAVLRVQTP